MRGRATTHVRHEPSRSTPPPTPQRPTPYRRRRTSAPRRFAVILLVIVALLACYGLGALFWASSRITREPVGGLEHGGVYHVLVTGSDSRENLSREQRNELNTGGDTGGVRTDTIFVLSIRGTKAAMLAFPRDLFVTRCDGTQGRINAATGIGGQECLVETVSQLSGLPIRHSMQIDFLGFRDVVEAVGGVDVCLDAPINDRDAGIDLPAGCQTLQGTDALGYVRVRKIDNDFGRIKRQQQFLAALAREVAQPSTVLNPLRFYGAAGAIGGALRADDGLSSFDLLRLGLGARGVATGRIVAETVPAAPATVSGAAVLDVNEIEAEPLFEQFRSGAIFEQATADETVDPADVELVVLNGSGIDGLAGQTRDELASRGFVVRDVGNAPAADTTVVRYPDGAQAEAQTVAAQVPGGAVDIEQDDNVDIITLVIGAQD